MKVSLRVQELAESATLAVASKTAALKASGIDIIGFGAGEPDFDTPEHIKAAATEALTHGLTKYPKPPSGLPEAKEAIRLKFKRENGLDYGASEVMVTSGCKMACYLALQATLDPGDEVIIPVPYWVSFPEMVKLAGGVPVPIDSASGQGFQFPADRIAAAVTPRTRLMILNSPNNPGGFVYTEADLRAGADLAQKHDLAVLADETYDRLLFGGRRHISFASLSDDAYQRTVTVNSGSKTYAMPGWRIGYAAGPQHIIKAMAKLQSQTTSGVAPFTQLALARALVADQECVEFMRREFETRGRHLARRLNELPGVHCPEPEGAFYTFPNVAGTYASLDVDGSVAFADRLLDEAKVSVTPGIAFGCDDHVRISFATSMKQIDIGLDRMVAWLAPARAPA